LNIPSGPDGLKRPAHCDRRAADVGVQIRRSDQIGVGECIKADPSQSSLNHIVVEVWEHIEPAAESGFGRQVQRFSPSDKLP